VTPPVIRQLTQLLVIGEAGSPKREQATAKAMAQATEVMSPETIIVDEAPPAPDYPRYRVRPGEPIVLADVDPDTSENKQNTSKRNLSISAIALGITSTSVCGEPAC